MNNSAARTLTELCQDAFEENDRGYREDGIITILKK